MNNKNQLTKIRQIRTDAYKEYLNLKYRLSNDRTMFTDEKEALVKKAYKKYKVIESEVDEIEDCIMLEELERDTIQSMKCPY